LAQAGDAEPVNYRILLVAAGLLLASCSSGATASRHSSASRDATSAAAPSSSATPTHSAASTTPGRPAGQFSMSFVGDVHFMDQVGERLARNPATVFGPTAAVLSQADLTMANLETAITTGGVQQNKEFTFRAPPAALVALRDAGIDVATMANNHGADYGTDGLIDSLRAIKDEHFPVVGIGADAAQAYAPYRTTLGGVKVAIFGADQVQDETTLRLFSAGAHSAGVANAFDPQLITAVRAAKRAGYVVVVYVHWGIEYQTCPSGNQTSLASKLAAAGASAVIGTHAHVLQGAGWLGNGTYVAYGLGNYLWWRTFGNNQDDNGVLTLTFRYGNVIAAHFAPSHLQPSGISPPATGADAGRILAEWNADRQCTDLSATAPR
jgi:poly-gamma-glutamate synthesis protein (capsule biosynthesis protein)